VARPAACILELRIGAKEAIGVPATLLQEATMFTNARFPGSMRHI
jgi:hypothetical protein